MRCRSLSNRHHPGWQFRIRVARRRVRADREGISHAPRLASGGGSITRTPQKGLPMNRSSLTPILIILLSVSCGRISAKERSALEAAVKALRKIEAATQVGVNYQQYGQLLIDGKAQVNESSAVISDGKLKQDINWTMDAYADAGTVWGK